MPTLVLSKGSRVYWNTVPYLKEVFFFVIRFARQQRDFPLQNIRIMCLWSPLHQTFLISCLQGSFCLCLSSSSVTSFLSPWGISKLHKVSPQRPWKIYLFLLLLSLFLIWFSWKRTCRRRDSRCQYICQHQLSQPSFNHALLSQTITNPSKILWEKLLDIYVEAIQ